MKIAYEAEKTPALFHASDAHVRGIMGPLGSGKSVACCIEILARSLRQAPDRDGVRRTRWAVVRQTYPELKSTTIKTWQEWIPEDVCPITWGTPIEAHMVTPLPDGTSVDMLVYFVAIDKPKQVKKLLSMELTGGWANEAREMDWQIVKALFSRTGRYPSKRGGLLTWSGVFMDTNPPDDDSWWYRMAEVSKPDGYEFFRQPGALIKVSDEEGRIKEYVANPEAENVQNQQLGYQYWMRLVSGKEDPDWVNIHCCGEYGSTFDGKPVYDQMYRDDFHVANEPLGWYKGLPIYLGWDFGLTPACVVGQITPFGQLRILREYTCKRGGIKQFATDVVIPQLKTNFPEAKIVSFGDPAGNQASQADSDVTCLQMLRTLGLPTMPAPTNDFLPRRQAVMDFLNRLVDGKPALLIDKSCKMIRKGFSGGYHFSRVQVAGEARFRDVPNKNKFSHVADAVQYLCLGVASPTALRPQNQAVSQEENWDGYT